MSVLWIILWDRISEKISASLIKIFVLNLYWLYMIDRQINKYENRNQWYLLISIQKQEVLLN